jgi:hypothetical protein
MRRAHRCTCVREPRLDGSVTAGLRTGAAAQAQQLSMRRASVASSSYPSGGGGGGGGTARPRECPGLHVQCMPSKLQRPGSASARCGCRRRPRRCRRAVGRAAAAAPSLRRSCAAALPLPPPPASSLLPPPPLLLRSPLSPPSRCGRNFGRRRSSFPARLSALARRFVAGHHSNFVSPMTCRLSSLIVCLHDPYTRSVFSEPLARRRRSYQWSSQVCWCWSPGLSSRSSFRSKICRPPGRCVVVCVSVCVTAVYGWCVAVWLCVCVYVWCGVCVEAWLLLASSVGPSGRSQTSCAHGSGSRSIMWCVCVCVCECD